MPAYTPVYKIPYPAATDTADGPAAMQAMAAKIESLLNPVGILGMWPVATPPVDWLICDGHTVSATTYPALAGVLGSAGGLITLPDFTNRFPMGVATATNPRATVGGANAVTLVASQIAGHVHPISDPTHAHSVYDPTHAHGISDPGHAHGYWDRSGDGSNSTALVTGAAGGSPVSRSGHTHGAGWTGSGGSGTGIGIYGAGTGIGIYGSGTGISVLGNTGGDQPHENRPLFQGVFVIIRSGPAGT
jgi:microcystin-dependent protein